MLLVQLLSTATAASIGPMVRNAFSSLDWDFQNDAQRQEYVTSGGYLCQPVGLRVAPATGDLYLTVPRFIKGVPAAIAKVGTNATGYPVLQPYPSWHAASLSTDGAVVSALGFAIDNMNRMWVADNGKAADLDTPAQPQLVIYDLDTGDVVRRHKFPEAVAPKASSFLNDLAVDTVDGFAYVSDSADPTSGAQGGVIVYDYNTDKSWRALSATSATIADDSVRVTINSIHIDPQPKGPRAGADGIALTPQRDMVVFTPLTSHKLYAIKTSVLRDDSLGAKVVADSVATIDLGDKDFSSDGIIFDHLGRLFIGDLDHSAVWQVNIHRPTSAWSSVPAGTAPTVTADMVRLAHDTAAMQWPDTIAFDHHGYLVFLSDGPAHFPPLDVTSTNFRVWSLDVGADYYMSDWQTPAGADMDKKWIIIGFAIAFGVTVTISGCMTWRRKRRERETDAHGGDSGHHALLQPPRPAPTLRMN